MSPLTIVKIGGKVVDHSVNLEKVLRQFAQLPHPKILVHGGGKAATELADRLNVKAPMIDGRRITDASMLDIATMIYGGLVNKRIVALLQSMEQNALGLTGADLNIIQAHKRLVKDIDYGYAGDIDKINIKAFQGLLSQHIVPVLASLTHNKKGQLLNTNADTIAAQVAIGLASEYTVTLMYCFEKLGVLADPTNDQSLIPILSQPLFDQLKETKQIHDGMIPKLDNAFTALNKGVKQVFIGNDTALSNLHQPPFLGTQLILAENSTSIY